MSILLSDFISWYPEIEDVNFYTDIYDKKEFYEEILERNEIVPSEKGILMKHQKIIARFLSGYTLYDSILLVHEMGVGKTCTAVGVIEQIQKESLSFTGSIIFGKGESVLQNFKNELIFQCTAGQYIPENWKFLSDKALAQRKRKQIEHYYSFQTFETFAKDLKKYTDRKIVETFSNKIIIIDEVHHLRIRKEEKNSADIYEQFYRFLHLIKNCKVIIMSGTPMTDLPNELASIINLIIPYENKLPTEENFDIEYLDNNNGLLTIKPDKLNILKNCLKGRISYLQSMKSSVEKKYIGSKNVGSLKHYIIQQDIMSEFQSTHYTIAKNSDTTTTGVYTNSRQATLFVFPNGSYGADGEKKYLEKKNKTSKLLNIKTSTTDYKIKPELLTRISGGDNNERIEKIRVFSSIYASTIDSILKAEDKSCLVYIKLVAGSGAILFSKILEQVFDFKKANGKEKENSKKNRYAILTGETMSSKELRDIIDRFNKPDNMKGEIIKVIIGSTIISEGFSLKNIQEIHILTPHWNYADTAQAIARGVRLGSHSDLLNNSIIPLISIYQHAAIPITENVVSIDLYRYETSEIKDINIKRMERILKETAFDCALTYNRNHIGNVYDGGLNGCSRIDGCLNTRECDYMNCEYTCESNPNNGNDHNGVNLIDYSTFQLYYDSDNINLIIKEIILLFQFKFVYLLNEFLVIFNSKFSLFEIISALRKMINESINIYNIYGFMSYIKEQNNVFFLVDNIYDTGIFLDKYYNENPYIIIPNNTYNNILDIQIIKMIPKTINKLFNSNIEDNILYLIQTLPLLAQEKLFEYCLIAEFRNIEKNNYTRRIILNYFKKYYKTIENKAVSSLLFNKYKKLRCLPLQQETGREQINQLKEWKECDKSIYDMFSGEVNSEEKRLEQNEYGIYAILDNDKFIIRNITADDSDTTNLKKKYSGKGCHSWDKAELVNIVVNIVKAHDIYINNIEYKNIDDCSKKSEDEDKSDLYDEYEQTTEELFTIISTKQFKDSKCTDLYKTIFRSDITDIEDRVNYFRSIETPDRKLYIRAIYWNKQKISFICTALKTWFKNNNLCIDKSKKAKTKK